MERHLPRWSQLRPLLRTQPITLDPVRRRLDRATSITDLRRIARRSTPRAVFDYTDGAAEAEVSLRRARRAFRRVVFNPSVLRDVSEVDTSTRMLGAPAAWPFAFAPTGFTRMMHTHGERAVARVAAETGIPYALSTMGTTSVEELADAVPDARRWFQLYVWKDRAATRDLVERARAAGYEALILTVDTPVGGSRLRDVRNGFSIPPTLTLRTIADGALHPAWWFDFLTTDPPTFASLRESGGTIADLATRMFDPSVTEDDIAWIRDLWGGKIIIKGVQTVADARRITDLGADALVLSNHGGRQLDRAPTPLEVLPTVVDAVGDRTEVYLDTGVLTGADIVAARALGATGTLVGRAYLYGLMAGGERGVRRATQILTAEITRTLQLLGVPRVTDLNRSHVTLPAGP